MDRTTWESCFSCIGMRGTFALNNIFSRVGVQTGETIFYYVMRRHLKFAVR